MLTSHIDEVTRDHIVGWAFDATDPTRPAELSILIDGRESARVCADLYRADLHETGHYGDGRHGFRHSFHTPLSATEDHDVMVRFRSTGEMLARGQIRIEKATTATADPAAPPAVRFGVAYGWAHEPPRFVIHVGPHKTGSTYLQDTFWQQRDALAKHGVLYPDTWFPTPDTPAHGQLVARLTAGCGAQLARDFATLSESGHATILLSAEDLVDLEQPELDTLRRVIGHHQAEVVFYCRRWSDLIYSGWQERVKQGETIAFPDFAHAEIADAAASPIINFDHRLRKLALSFGKDNVRLISYSNLVDDGIDLFDDFVKTVLRLDAVMPAGDHRPNAALDMYDIEMVRALNALGRARRRHFTTEIHNAYLEIKNEINISRILASMSENIRRFSFDDAAPALHDIHQELAAAYRELMARPDPEGLLFRPRRRDIHYIGPDYVFADRVMDALRIIFRKIERSGVLDKGDAAIAAPADTDMR